VTDPAAGSAWRVEALTGVRFFAALAVFGSHLAKPAWVPAPLRWLMSSGSNGVTIFFVLSGFVIALNYFDTFRRPTGRGIWNYGVGRLARIYPLYATVLVFVFLSHGAPRADRLGLHLAAVQTWHPDLSVAYAFNGPGWSVGVEFFAYACFPLLVLLLAGASRRTAALVLIGLALVAGLFLLAAWFQSAGLDLSATNPHSAHRWIYRSPVTRLGDFAVGAVTALVARNLRTRTDWARWPRHLTEVATWGPALLIVGLMCWPGKQQYVARLDALWVLPAALLFLGLAVLPAASLSRLLSTRPLLVLGETSFAFYLVHRPLMFAFDDRTVAQQHGPLVYAAFSVALLGMIIVVAVGANQVIERPARRWLNSRLKLPSPVDRGGRVADRWAHGDCVGRRAGRA
jgi:peptidoglycan/LPS O-acetylase OafA/YrhL